MSEDHTDDRKLLTNQDIEDEGLDDWRVLFGTLHARFATGDFATGIRLVDAIAVAAEEADHHPDVGLSYPRVDVRLSSHDVGGITQRDVRLARRISAMAAGEATAEPESVSALEFALDTADHAALKPFWAAVLGYDIDEDFDGQIVDPHGKQPTIWFQQSDPDEVVPSQRWHLDVRVPPEVAPHRIQAGLDAGGTLVSDEKAPAFWVLADPQGNKVCITTWQGRDFG
jgi:4a-hydroxytetrahydrobiopterin dehydratase